MRDADGATLIDIDSTPKTIGRYRLDANLENVLEMSLLAPPDSLPGYPDGLRPTPDGKSVVVAFFNPDHAADGVAKQFRLSDGLVECEWTIPGSPRVTCPEFVRIGGEVKLLFVTATEGMPEETRAIAPLAGQFFIADTLFTELPPHPHLVPMR
jgi:sugar lactone lactonase YvrE